MKKLALAAAVALATTACIISTDDDSTFTIVNDSDYVLVAVYIAEISDPSWGPNLLPDVPQVKTYINTYDDKPVTLEALLEKLEGRSEFLGSPSTDVFCGLPDTRV